MPWWKVALKFWYVPLLVGLAVCVLWQRNDLTGTKAELAASEARTRDVTNANQSLSTALTQVRLQRIDNDAIALAVAAKVGKNRDVETHTETIIEKAAQNDPNVRTWADNPLPDSVRDALRAH